MTCTLDPSFLRAVVLMTNFRAGKAIRGVQAALLYIGLRHEEFTAADIPREVLTILPCDKPSTHLSGAAVGALISMGLLEVLRRVPSANPSAKGRKVDVLRIPAAKVNTARTWLAQNGFPVAETQEAFSLES